MLYPKIFSNLLLLVLSLFSLSAPAAIVVTAYESGTDVIFEAEGSLDITGLTPLSSGNTNAFISPAENRFSLGATDILPFDFYLATSSARAFGSLFITSFADSGEGMRLGASASGINLPANYESGTDISASAIFNLASFESLGLIEGSYIWTLSTNDSLTLNVTTAPIPLPAAIWMLLSGLVFLSRPRSRPLVVE